MGTVRIKPLSEKALVIRGKQPQAKVIQLIPNQIITRRVVRKILLKNGVAHPNVREDILKMVVIERHRATGNIGIGFVQGFGLKKGAIGSTVAHDSHNLVIVGTNDPDILKIIEEIRSLGGGMAVASDGKGLGFPRPSHCGSHVRDLRRSSRPSVRETPSRRKRARLHSPGPLYELSLFLPCRSSRN